MSPTTASALEKKLAGSSTAVLDDEIQPLQTEELKSSATIVFTITGDEELEDLENDENPDLKEASTALAKGRLPSQTTSAQRREDTRP